LARRPSSGAGSAKIIRPAEVWITDVTTAVIVWFNSRLPFWTTTIVQAADSLSRLLAFTRDRDDDFLTRNGDRPHGLRELVQVQHLDTFKARDPVQVEVIGHDRPALALGGSHKVGVDLHIRRHVIVDDLERY